MMQLSTDKRIRIILNRQTVLHDTLLAFATLTTDDMVKQIRLQFNGEVGVKSLENILVLFTVLFTLFTQYIRN